MMKKIFRKRLVANITDQVWLGQQGHTKLRRYLLQEDRSVRFQFAHAVTSLVDDTAAKYGISSNAALHGNSLRWRQLAEAIDDWEVALQAALRLYESPESPTAQMYGLMMGKATVLYRTIYQMKFNQQQFPEFLADEVSNLLRACTQLSELLYDLAKGKRSDRDLLEFLHGKPFQG